MGKNEGQLLTKYAQFAFDLAHLHREFTQTPESGLHWKFYGTVLIEVLRVQPGNQVLMFNVLPFIAQGLKSSIKEIKIASLLAISQVCSRKSLSQEYTLAFVQEIIAAVKAAENDESFKEQGLVVLLIIFQYQNITSLPEKDVAVLLALPRISKSLSKLTANHDSAHLFRVIVQSYLQSTTIDAASLKPLIASCINLKIIFVIIEATISALLEDEEKQARGAQVLAIVKEADASGYNQCLLHIIKQTPNPLQKDKILELLQKGSKHPNLVSKFGDKEYSLLSALGSQQKQTKSAALKAINAANFSAKLTIQENELIKLQLISLLAENSEDEPMVESILTTLSLLSTKGKINNAEFDCLEAFIDQNFDEQRYSKPVIELAIKQATQLQVSDEHRQTSSLLLQLFTNSISNVPTPFKPLFEKQRNKLDLKLFADLVLANEGQCLTLLGHIFGKHKGYHSYQLVASLLSQVSSTLQAKRDQHAEEITAFYSKLLLSLKTVSGEESFAILESVISGLPQTSRHPTLENKIHKCLSKVLKISLANKLKHSSFQLSAIHVAIYQKQFSSNLEKVVEFYLAQALTGKNEQKRVFSVLSLAQIAKHRSLTPSILLSSLLILLNSDSKIVREYAFKLADAFTGNDKVGSELEIYGDRKKPHSAKKSDSQQESSLSQSQACSLIKDLTKLRQEIVQDRNQLDSALSKSKHLQVFTGLARSLLSFPNAQIKLHLIGVLSLPSLTHNKSNEILTAGLLANLQDEYKLKNSLDQHDNLYLSSVAALIANMCSNSPLDVAQQRVTSLALPYIKFSLGLLEKRITIAHSFEESLSRLFVASLCNQNLLKTLKAEALGQVIWSYSLTQQYLHSKTLRVQIKQGLSQASAHAISAEYFKPLLTDCIQELNSNKEGAFAKLEIALESLLSLKLKDNTSLLPTIFNIIALLGNLTGQKDVSYLIEIGVQFCVQAIDDNQASKGTKVDFQDDIQTVRDILEKQLQSLRVYLQSQLSQVEKGAKDPFKEYLMEVDSKEVDGVQDNQQELLPIFQVLNSVFSLLCIIEGRVSRNIVHTENFLAKQSKVIIDLVNNGEDTTSTRQHLIDQLFRFYHQQVLKATAQTKEQNQDVKEIVATYIDTLLGLQGSSTSEELYSYLSKLLATIASAQNNSLVLLILMNHAKNKASVKENMQLDNTEIQIIEKIIVHNPDTFTALTTLQELLFITTVISLSESQGEHLAQKLSLLFDDVHVSSVQELAAWSKQKYATEDKEVRKLKYLTLYVINEWFENNQQFQKQLSALIHSKAVDSEVVFDQFYRIYLSSYILQESVSNSLQNKFFEDNKAKKSLKRLSKRNQALQTSLNQILSYDVQVSITLKVLNYTNKQITTLKTNTLQLLINKTPSFSQELSHEKQKQLIGIFTPLIAKAIETLKQVLSESKLKKSNDQQQLAQALFGIIGRTACAPLEHKLKVKTLDLTLSFLSQAANYSLTLHSSLLITAMSLFEVYQTEILEEMPSYFGMVMAAFTRMFEAAEAKNFFVTSFSQSVLKATLSLCTFFSKFLNALQFESVIKNVLIVQQDYDTEVRAILDVISQEAVQQSGLKLVFLAVFNSFEAVIVEQGVRALALPNISLVAQRFFGNLLTPVIKRMKKEFCQENHKKIFRFFKQAFALSETFYQTNSSNDIADIDDVESRIVESFQQFAIKLSEEMLRPHIMRLVKWAYAKKHMDNTMANPINLHRSIMLFRLLNGLLDILKEYFVPLQTLYLEKLIELLSNLVSQFSSEPKQGNKRLRSEQDVDLQATEGHNLQKLLNLAVENTRLNFLFDTNQFIQNDTFEQLSDPVANLTTLVGLGSNYKDFIDIQVRVLVLDMVERINNDDMWKILNYEILLKTRNENAQIRLGALKVIEHLFMRVGERFLVLLNDTLPFLSESMEDENPEVETVAKAIVKRIESLTGDSIQEYLK